jgi:aminopeptidase C
VIQKGNKVNKAQMKRSLKTKKVSEQLTVGESNCWQFAACNTRRDPLVKEYILLKTMVLIA